MTILNRRILAGVATLALALPAAAGAQPADAPRGEQGAVLAVPPAPLAPPPPVADDAEHAHADGWRVVTIVESALLAASAVGAAGGAQLLRRQRAVRSMPYTG